MAQQKTEEVSEAEIAVHWQEEAHVHPPEKFVAQANLTDRSGLRPIQSRQLPGLLQGVRRPSRLVQDLGRHARHEQSAVLEMVRRRQDQRQL